MPPTRLQRSGATLDELRAAVRTEFGAAARIVAAERVTTPGIAGLFRRAHIEATVEVPSVDEPPTARVAIADGPATRAGIAALLADAEEAEARIAAADGTADARADAFAAVLDGFSGLDGPTPSPEPDRRGGVRGSLPSDALSATRPGGAVPVVPSALPPTVVATALRPAPPAVRDTDGDLVVLVGRATDVDAAAGVFAARHGLRPTDAADRRAGILARAEGVREGHALLGVAAWTDTATLVALAPDQTWVVVDAGRKHEDAVAMTAAVAAVVPVAGVVVIGTDETASPDTVHLLGVPVRSL